MNNQRGCRKARAGGWFRKTYPLGPGYLASALHELLRGLDLTVLGFQLDSREPDALAVRIRLERATEDLPGAVDVAAIPRLLGRHQPQHLCLRNRLHRPFEQRK